ncbi:MAG: hypothetical protein WDM70_05715 [Nitrosomonadales bacterium]
MAGSNRFNVFLNILALTASIVLTSGCHKISEVINVFSPEKRFLSSLDARWTDANNANVMVSAIEGEIVVIDANGEMYALSPTGKFDSTNKTLPVKMTIIPKVDGTQDVVAETLVRYVPANVSNASGSQKGCGDKIDPDLSAKLNFKNSFSNEHVACLRKFAVRDGMTSLQQKITPAVTELKSDNVLQNLFLYNASTDSENFRLGLKRDGGDKIWDFSFVRKLNDDEIKQLTAFANNPRQRIDERNAIVDKTIADILSYIEKQAGK